MLFPQRKVSKKKHLGKGVKKKRREWRRAVFVNWQKEDGDGCFYVVGKRGTGGKRGGNEWAWQRVTFFFLRGRKWQQEKVEGDGEKMAGKWRSGEREG